MVYKSCCTSAMKRAEDDPDFGFYSHGVYSLVMRWDEGKWQHTQDYWSEKDEFLAIDLDDGSFVYE
jgi:hypothetical protein